VTAAVAADPARVPSAPVDRLDDVLRLLAADRSALPAAPSARSLDR
jgi:hypothetical protein